MTPCFIRIRRHILPAPLYLDFLSWALNVVRDSFDEKSSIISSVCPLEELSELQDPELFFQRNYHPFETSIRIEIKVHTCSASLAEVRHVYLTGWQVAQCFAHEYRLAPIPSLARSHYTGPL